MFLHFLPFGWMLSFQILYSLVNCNLDFLYILIYRKFTVYINIQEIYRISSIQDIYRINTGYIQDI